MEKIKNKFCTTEKQTGEVETIANSFRSYTVPHLLKAWMLKEVKK